MVVFLALVVGALLPDTIQLQSGGHVEGVVLKEEDGKVVVHLKHGMATLNREDIASITKEESAPIARGRIAPWTACFRTLAGRPWGQDLRPAPAVIIDGGPFKNVPYTSDRSGSREINLYGDPDRPAGLEFGLSKELLQNLDARKELIGLLKALLGEAKDQEAAASLDPSTKGKKEADGLTFEIDETPNAGGTPTWFLSVYDAKALEDARVPEKEVRAAAQEGGGKPGSTVAAPGGSSGKSSPGTTTTTPDTSGTFGFSPGAYGGEKSGSSRSYSSGGGNWNWWWRQRHPPAPPTTKPKTGSTPQK